MARNAEQALISSIIREDDFQAVLAAGCSPDWFHAYRDEYEWLDLYYGKHKKSPSRVAFHHQFPEFVMLKANDTKHYVSEVRESHIRYQLNSVIKKSLDHVAAGDNATAIQTLHTGVLEVSKEAAEGQPDSDILRDYGDVITEIRTRRERVTKTGMAGFPTGFETLDLRTGGYQPGHIWVIAGRPGASKTYTMLRMAASVAMMGYHVQFDALEMTRPEVAIRLQPFFSGLLGKQVFNSLDVTQGRNYSLLAYKKHMREMAGQVQGRVHINDTQRGRVSALDVAAQIERNSPDVVFIDYLTLMDRKGPGDWQAIAALMGELKSIAMEYQVPVIVASQLNRASTSMRDPGVESLSQADSIGQDADAVVIVQKLSTTVRKFSLPKYRHGLDGYSWYTEFRPNEGVFREVTGDRAQDLRDLDSVREG